MLYDDMDWLDHERDRMRNEIKEIGEKALLSAIEIESIYYFYVKALSINDTAKAMRYSEDSVYKIKRKALEKMDAYIETAV